MRWQMNKCYDRPCGSEEIVGPLDPLLPTGLPSQLITLPPLLHPSLHGTLSVPHSKPQRPIKMGHLPLTTGFRAGYIVFTEKP